MDFIRGFPSARGFGFNDGLTSIIIPLFEENRKVWYDARRETTE
jgi:hypothetical protein